MRPKPARDRAASTLDVTTFDAQTLAADVGRHRRTAQRAIAAAARDNPDAVRVVRTGKRGRPKRVLLLPDAAP